MRGNERRPIVSCIFDRVSLLVIDVPLALFRSSKIKGSGLYTFVACRLKRRL
jgi:hypothetical protein